MKTFYALVWRNRKPEWVIDEVQDDTISYATSSSVYHSSKKKALRKARQELLFEIKDASERLANLDKLINQTDSSILSEI